MTFAYWREHKIDIRVVRIFNTYGPRMRFDDGRVISNFVFQALTGRDLTVYGKGSYTRSFCYVDDLIEGICRFMPVNFTGPLNLGTTYEFSVLELAKKVIKLTKSKSKIIFLPLPRDDPRQRRPDLSMAKKLLKWQPRVGLDDGLKKPLNGSGKIWMSAKSAQLLFFNRRILAHRSVKARLINEILLGTRDKPFANHTPRQGDLLRRRI